MPIGAIKETVTTLLEIAEKARDLDLKKAILDVQEELLSEQDRNIGLTRRTLELKRMIGDLEGQVETLSAREAEVSRRESAVDAAIAAALREDARKRVCIGAEEVALVPSGAPRNQPRLDVRVVIQGGAQFIEQPDKVTVFDVFVNLGPFLGGHNRLDRRDVYHSVSVNRTDVHINAELFIDATTAQRILRPTFPGRFPCLFVAAARIRIGSLDVDRVRPEAAILVNATPQQLGVPGDA